MTLDPTNALRPDAYRTRIQPPNVCEHPPGQELLDQIPGLDRAMLWIGLLHYLLEEGSEHPGILGNLLDIIEQVASLAAAGDPRAASTLEFLYETDRILNADGCCDDFEQYPGEAPD